MQVLQTSSKLKRPPRLNTTFKGNGTLNKKKKKVCSGSHEMKSLFKQKHKKKYNENQMFRKENLK